MVRQFSSRTELPLARSDCIHSAYSGRDMCNFLGKDEDALPFPETFMEKMRWNGPDMPVLGAIGVETW